MNLKNFKGRLAFFIALCAVCFAGCASGAVGNNANVAADYTLANPTMQQENVWQESTLTATQQENVWQESTPTATQQENVWQESTPTATMQGNVCQESAPTATLQPNDDFQSMGEPSAMPDIDLASEENQSSLEGGSVSEVIDRDGIYSSKDDVALYLETYNELPDNYITKNEARELGWSGGSLEPYAPGKCIGGDKFGNYEGILPDGNYYECDIDTLGAKSRGAKRIVYSSDGRIYYTDDHYESFELLYE